MSEITIPVPLEIAESYQRLSESDRLKMRLQIIATIKNSMKAQSYPIMSLAELRGSIPVSQPQDFEAIRSNLNYRNNA